MVGKSKSDMISRGERKYITGIKQIGGSKAYYDCGAKGGMDVAICLVGLREALSEEDWGHKWAAAMQ